MVCIGKFRLVDSEPPQSGETTTETDQLTVAVNRNAIAPGNYSGIITITSDGGNKVINVSMEVKDEITQTETQKKPKWQ